MIGVQRPQGEGVIALGEFERHGGDGRGGAMLDGEHDAVVAVPAKIEVGITPGVEFGRAALDQARTPSSPPTATTQDLIDAH